MSKEKEEFDASFTLLNHFKSEIISKIKEFGSNGVKKEDYCVLIAVKGYSFIPEEVWGDHEFFVFAMDRLKAAEQIKSLSFMSKKENLLAAHAKVLDKLSRPSLQGTLSVVCMFSLHEKDCCVVHSVR